MASIRAGRHTADLTAVPGDELVVFLIGMRVNRPWKVASWWPVFTAMPRMLRYLQQRPEKGLLGYHQAFLPSPMVVQYWRSFADLERFARDRNDPHLEPWRQFNRRVADNGDVGIWHETYVIEPGKYENIYNNMPPYGLGAAATLVDALGARQEARQRILAAQA
jgi:hypothetical protein